MHENFLIYSSYHVLLLWYNAKSSSGSYHLLYMFCLEVYFEADKDHVIERCCIVILKALN